MKLAFSFLVLASLFLAGSEVGAWAGEGAKETLAPFEVLKSRTDYDVNADGTFTRTIENVWLVRTQQGVQSLTQISIGFSEALQQAEFLEAYTIKPDGRRIDVPPDQIFLRASPMATGAPMFDDVKILIAVFSNMAVGDRVGFKARLTQKEALYPGQFSMLEVYNRDVINRDTEITLTAPADLPLTFDVAQFDTPPPVLEDGKRRWRWVFKNETLAPVDDNSTVSYFDRDPSIAVSSRKDYAALADAYRARAEDKATITPAIQALADDITRGIDDQREQARLLYEWVARNIRYVGIELGTGGVVPHPAQKILDNRYGDCKDHVTLLQALLSAKAIGSDAALIDAGNNNFHLSQAAISNFNHIITYLPQWDLYLDSTARFYPFGVLPVGDRDKPVLLINAAKIAQTPPLRAADNVFHATRRVIVQEDGSAISDGEVTVTGPSAAPIRAQMEAMVRPDQEDYFLRRYFGNQAEGTLTKGDWQDWQESLTFSAHYLTPNYIAVPGPGSVALTVLATDSVWGWIDPGLPMRHYDYVCGRGSVTEETIVTFPKSVHIMAVPKSGRWQSDGVTLELSYQRLGPHVIKAKRSMVRDAPHHVCTADYFNRMRPEIVKLRGFLRAETIYR